MSIQINENYTKMDIRISQNYLSWTKFEKTGFVFGGGGKLSFLGNRQRRRFFI